MTSVVTFARVPSGRRLRRLRRLRHLKRTGLSLLLCFAALATGCRPNVGEGQFHCIPEAEAPCPPGFSCQRRGEGSVYQCYQEPGDLCGDNVADPSEPCDGNDLAGAQCSDHGFFAGTLSCDPGCVLSTDGCVHLQSVTFGSSYACGLDHRGGVWCWGSSYNDWGSTPQAVRMDIPTPVTELVAGNSVLALDEQGVAWCRGPGLPCGVGSSYLSLHESWPVAGGHTFVQLDTHAHYSCGLKENGEAWCWGALKLESDEGFVGEQVLQPEPAAGDQRFEVLTVGSHHACGLDALGRAWCWGANDDGQLGIGAGDATSVAVPVVGDHTFEQLVAGSLRTCGIDDDSQLWCWGADYGPTFTSEDASHPEPVPEQAALRFQAVALDSGQTCGIDTEGGAWCWNRSTDAPRPLFEDRDVRAIWTGYNSDVVCASDGQQALYCQGWNGAEVLAAVPGQLEPRAVMGSYDAIHGGRRRTCGITNQVVHCWGADLLGDGLQYTHAHPQSVTHPAPEALFVTLDMGTDHTCGVDIEQRIWCWGEWTDDLPASEPELVSDARAYRELAAGYYFTCALDDQGQAWCWGSYYLTPLGIPPTEDVSEPRAVVGGHEFRSISTNGSSVYAIDHQDRPWCWGTNLRGICGIPREIASTYEPTAVQGDLSLSALATYGQGACGLDFDGRAWCWGNAESGENGFGHTGWTDAPGPVVGDHVFASLTGGGAHMCGIDVDDRAWCWGSNTFGALGDGTVQDRSVPTAVAGDHRFESLSAGYSHTCGVDTAGQSWCWGQNTYGQTGQDDRITEPLELRGN